jgi:uncharacterized iron-regulated protein
MIEWPRIYVITCVRIHSKLGIILPSFIILCCERISFLMMGKFIILFFLLLMTGVGRAQHENAFAIYTAKGKKSTYKQMKKSLLSKQVVLFGELHDNPIAHWLQFELMKDLFQLHSSNLTIGMEMFERDQQLLLNDFLIGVINQQFFEDSCRIWPNYKTDYFPIIQFAKMNQLNCIATNVPRRYASQLFKKGRASLDSLSEWEKSFMASLDFPIDTSLSQYAALNKMGEHMQGSYLLEAQALKDATMAQSIQMNKNANNVFLHLNGTYHSDYFQGIFWYLKLNNPNLNIGTISTVTQDNVYSLEKENMGKADFIICVPETMTRTH